MIARLVRGEDPNGTVAVVADKAELDVEGGLACSDGATVAASVAEEIERRSDPRRRRKWLRNLDLVLAEEFHAAGALSPAELVQMAEHPLKGLISNATIDEWWEYACRRGWLKEQADGRCRLTKTARHDLKAWSDEINAPDYTTWARAIMRWLLPTGAAATAYLGSRYGLLWLGTLAVAVVTALVLFAMTPVLRAADGPMNRWMARRMCDLLDGRHVTFVIVRYPAVPETSMRRSHQ